MVKKNRYHRERRYMGQINKLENFKYAIKKNSTWFGKITFKNWEKLEKKKMFCSFVIIKRLKICMKRKNQIKRYNVV